MEALLNYSNDNEKTQLGMGLFYHDTFGKLNVLDPEDANLKLNRNDYGKLTHTASLQGLIHTVTFNQGKRLINYVPLRITLHRLKNHFVLLSAHKNPDYIVQVLGIVFCLWKVQLTLNKFEETHKQQERGPVLYHLSRVDIQGHSLAAGLTLLYWDNAILVQYPACVLTGMISNAAFNVTIWIV